jgi:hypothetical protein
MTAGQGHQERSMETLYVRLNEKEQLVDYLGTDIGFAQWKFDRDEESGDILASVTREQYEKLCEGSRYRLALLKAAKTLEA